MPAKITIPKWINHNTFGIFISIVFLILIFKNIDIDAVLHSVKGFNPIYIIPALFVYTISYIVRSIRWKSLLSVSKNINFYKVLKALYIGYMANTLLPARMGELYRAHVIGTDQNIKRSSALASIFAERVFDGLILTMLLLLLIVFFYNKPWLIKIGIVTGSIFIGGFIVLIFFSRKSLNNNDIVNKIIKFIPKSIQHHIETILFSFMNGLGVLSSIKVFIFLIFTSISIWFIEWSVLFIIVSGFESLHPIRPIIIAFLLVMAAFSTMIPSGPGFVGPYQYAFIVALSLASISKDTSLAIAITTQVVMMTPVVCIGMILLWKSHLTLGKVPDNSKTL